MATMNTSEVVAKLVFPGQTFEMVGDPRNGGIMAVGTFDECFIRLDDPSISMLHACIERFSGGFKIDDIRSETGTFINGQRHDCTGVITSTCVLRFGNVEGNFIIPPDMEQDFKRNLKSLEESGWTPHERLPEAEFKRIMNEARKVAGKIDSPTLQRTLGLPSGSN